MNIREKVKAIFREFFAIDKKGADNIKNHIELFPNDSTIQYLARDFGMEYEKAFEKIHPYFFDINKLSQRLNEYWEDLVKKADSVCFSDEDYILFLWKKILFFRYDYTQKLLLPLQKSYKEGMEDRAGNLLKLYHYTTADSCQEIFKTRQIRLRNKGFNDPHEDLPADIYAGSFSLLGDHPTLFRLYGDNTKGVCIEFQVLSSQNQDIVRHFPFLIHYGESENSRIQKIRENLIGIANFQQEFPNMLKICNPMYTISKKSIAYKDENEVRIIHTVNTSEEEITTIPFHTLGLNPTSVILGYNCRKNLENIPLPLKNSQFKFIIS